RLRRPIRRPVRRPVRRPGRPLREECAVSSCFLPLCGRFGGGSTRGGGVALAVSPARATPRPLTANRRSEGGGTGECPVTRDGWHAGVAWPTAARPHPQPATGAGQADRGGAGDPRRRQRRVGILGRRRGARRSGTRG